MPVADIGAPPASPFPASDISTPQSHPPSIASQLETVDTVSAREEISPLTREINRVLDRIQELQNAKDQQGKDTNSHLRKIERELRDLSAFIRGRPDTTSRRDVASGKTPSVSRAPSERVGYLSPPPLRPESPASFISSVSFLSSHYSDDLSESDVSPSPKSSPSTVTAESPPPSEPPGPPGPSEPPRRSPSSSETTSTARPLPDLSQLRDMLTALQQQHAKMMNDQKETKDLVQKFMDQCPPHRPPSRPDRDEARRTVEDLLGRILNALGLPAERERPPSRAPTPESEGSTAEKLADEVLTGKWRQLNRSPIVEPQPLRPSSELNLEDWESYLDSEEQGVPPPTLIDLPPPVSFVQVPTATTIRARSVSPTSTIEETVAGEPPHPRRRRSPEREREEREREEREWEEGTSSSGPPRHSLRTPRVGESDPGLDFLNLVKDHRRARRGGDGTFIPGDQAVSNALACHNCPISYGISQPQPPTRVPTAPADLGAERPRPGTWTWYGPPLEKPLPTGPPAPVRTPYD